MKPLIILLTAFALTLLTTKIFGHDWNFILSGNTAMSAMLLFTAIGHFVYQKGMAMMIPGFIPFKTSIIYLTGLIEITAAAGLLINSTRSVTGLMLIIFFIVILPANINAAIHKVDFQKSTYEGSGPGYLWFRVPLQIFFILWTWYFAW